MEKVFEDDTRGRSLAPPAQLASRRFIEPSPYLTAGAARDRPNHRRRHHSRPPPDSSATRFKG